MFYIVGVVIAFFLAFLLLTKRKTQADFVLMVWLSIIGCHLFLFYLYISGIYLSYLFIIPLALPLPLLHGPLLYLYTLASTSPRRLSPKHLLHFLPAALLYTFYCRYLFSTDEELTRVFLEESEPDKLLSVFKTSLIYLSGITYISLSVLRLLRYRKQIVQQFSNTEKINFSWLLYLILWLSVIWCILIVLHDDRLIFGTTVAFVAWLGYFGIRQLSVFHSRNMSPSENTTTATEQAPAGLSNDDEDIDYEQEPGSDAKKQYKSGLSDEAASEIHEKLKELMISEKPYTIPELTLGELAQKLQVHPHLLSQVINSFEHKNFYDYINEQRIGEFLRAWAIPENKKYTILSVALECGFNSKASFNRNFKKFTGSSPSDYQEPEK